MNEKDNQIEILFENRNDRFKSYWFRLAVQGCWYLILFGTATYFLYRESGYLAFYVLTPLFLLWLTWDYLAERRFSYTTLYVSLNKGTGTLTIQNIDRKNSEFKMKLDMRRVKVKLRELRLGRLYVPNYELIISDGNEVKYRQKGNYVISRTKIKEVANKLIDYQVAEGNQKRPELLGNRLKKKIKTLANKAYKQ